MKVTLNKVAMSTINFVQEQLHEDHNQADVAKTMCIALGMVCAAGHLEKDDFERILDFTRIIFKLSAENIEEQNGPKPGN
jgi:hypothetical protein